MSFLTILAALLTSTPAGGFAVKRRDRQLDRTRRVGDDTGWGSRSIFVAGLEGSGHHFLEDLWERLHKTAGFKIQDVDLPVHWCCPAEWIKQDGYTDMVLTFESLEEGPVYMFPTEYSYPCGKARHDNRRDRFFPRIDWISEAATETATDFHVIFLYRPMEDVLAADCLHRKMEGRPGPDSCNLQVETLMSNADHLLTQMDSVRKKGPHQVQCMVYGDLPQMINSMESALGIDLNLGDAMRQTWQPSQAEDDRKSLEWWPAMVDRLRDFDAELLKTCNASPRISNSSNFLDMFHHSEGPLL